ncbi:MAG: 2 protein [Ignavibacteria bacterium]|nr:2 protein [Ignavibacteria bacterium]
MKLNEISNNQHQIIASVFFCALLVFIRLGYFEIQPGEEGASAMLARASLHTSEKGDVPNSVKEITTEKLSDKEQSSTANSQVCIKMEAAFISVLGESGFALRLFSALCSALSLIMVYLISKRIVTRQSDGTTIFLLAGTYLWNEYSRQALEYVPLAALMLLSLWTVIKLFEEKKVFNQYQWGALIALVMFLLLLTDINFWFVAVLFIIPFLTQGGYKRQKLILLISSFAAVIIAMLLRSYNSSGNANSLTSAFYFQYPFLIEKNEHSVLYYINQLVISNPLFLILLVFAIAALFRFKLARERMAATYNKRIVYSVMSWFYLLFIILSAAPGKQRFFTVLLIPPAIILSVWIAESLTRFIGSAKVRFAVFTSIILSVFWALSSSLRDAVMKLELQGILLLFAVLIIMLGIMMLRKERIERRVEAAFGRLLQILPAILIFRVTLFIFVPPNEYSLGAVEMAAKLKESEKSFFVYVYHQNNLADSMNYQLDWYLKGWMSGEQKGRTYIPLDLPANKPDLYKLNALALFPESFVIYYFNDSAPYRKFIFAEVQRTRKLLAKTKNYALFGRYTGEGDEKPGKLNL